MRTPRPVVLLLTHSADHFTVDRVADALARRGARPFRLDTDAFPAHAMLSARLGRGPARHRITCGAESVSSGEVHSVWARKIWKPALSPELDPQFREACERESRAALLGFLDGLSGARWINAPLREQQAGSKPLQLRLAAAAGLQVPRTLITNDPDEARRFFGELEGRVVAKLLAPLSVGMEASGPFLYTSPVREEDLAEAEQLRHCPVVFQERIPKARELRVAFVGGALFTGAVDASRSAAGSVDWRLAAPEECRWTPDELPPELARALRDFMAALGLSYGAIDLIRTPDGEHVFLEVNPGGEWGMLERDLGHPISDALARELMAEGGMA